MYGVTFPRVWGKPNSRRNHADQQQFAGARPKNVWNSAGAIPEIVRPFSRTARFGKWKGFI
jgi:hypothetical protein